MERPGCTLPGGYIDEAGILHRTAELWPLTGREEEVLAAGGQDGGARAVTDILSRCVRCIGDIRPVTEAVARRLLVADRQYLLLKLREITFGNQVQATIHCPWPDCRQRVDIDFSIQDIPVKESTDKRPWYTLQLPGETQLPDGRGTPGREIVFRLPCGADQEIVSPLLAVNEAEALTLLLRRCVQGIDGQEPPPDDLIEGLTPQDRMEIERRMAAVAPQVELTLGAGCPECGRDFALPFDLQDFFFGELRISQDLLYREIHYLAYHYHWSEKEILEMPREKRRKYIEILADEIEKLNSAVV